MSRASLTFGLVIWVVLFAVTRMSMWAMTLYRNAKHCPACLVWCRIGHQTPLLPGTPTTPAARPLLQSLVFGMRGSMLSTASFRLKPFMSRIGAPGSPSPHELHALTVTPWVLPGYGQSGNRPKVKMYTATPMLTISADTHPLMNHFHNPTDEKRMIVILPPDRYQDWLTAPAEISMEFMMPVGAEVLQAVAG